SGSLPIGTPTMVANVDLPTFVDAGHSHTLYGLNTTGGLVATSTTEGRFPSTWDAMPTFSDGQDWRTDRALSNERRIQKIFTCQPHPKKDPPGTPTPAPSSRRIVRVVIIDPDDNVPLNDSILFKGEEKYTDLTDQELFFEVDIKNLLEAHN